MLLLHRNLGYKPVNIGHVSLLVLLFLSFRFRFLIFFDYYKRSLQELQYIKKARKKINKKLHIS